MTSETFHTMCPMNCHPTLCGMTAEVADGELVSTKGDKNNPDSQGFLCVRGRAAEEIVGNGERLLYPLVRDSRDTQDWKRISWDEILDRIASAMRDTGGERVGIWPGHGNGSNDYAVGVKSQLINRFANLLGVQSWHPTMICWGLGGFGLGLTGALETSTKEDMSGNSDLIILWAANITSQPNTARYLKAAKRRGAKVITIDVRETEAAVQSDEVYLLKPASDPALALAMMHVIIGEGLHDDTYISEHTVGFDDLADHVKQFTPDWAAEITGLTAEQITHLARTYAQAKPAMMVIGGSSMHKGPNGWLAARAVSCLPALTGNLGVPGGGIGPRHGSSGHGKALGDISAAERKPAGYYIPNQMPEIVESLRAGKIDVLMLPGSNMLSSYPDANDLAEALQSVGLIISTDLFMNETARRSADIILPSTAWLEELGCKSTNTHLYLMDKALEAPGETKPLVDVLKALADRLNLEDFYPWASHEDCVDAVINHPFTGNATVAKMRANGGRAELKTSHVAYPTHDYHTPSGKIEFYSARAEEAGLPPLPEPAEAIVKDYPLTLCQGRTITQFHSFYDQGQALPSLAAKNPGPELWMSPADAQSRNLSHGDTIRVYNSRGTFAAAAHISDSMSAGTVWMRDGWAGLNKVTSGEPVLPADALEMFPFSVGQSDYGAQVEVEAAG